MHILLSVIESFILVSALSIDSFAASFSYGVNKIKIPLRSVVVISFICSLFLSIFMLVGRAMQNVIPKEFAGYICFIILFFISMTKFFDWFIKEWIKKSNSASPTKSFHFLNYRFLLQVMCDPTEGDADHSKILSVRESIALAVALSLDGIAVGFGTGLISVNYIEIFILSLITGITAIVLGCIAGNRIADRVNLNISWISGAVLLILAVLKLF